MKGLLLASGGIDSPVAGYLAGKAGIDVIAVHFSNEPFTDKKAEEKTLKLMKKIGLKKVYVVPHGKSQAEIIRKANRKYQCVLCRRMMFRVAERIAENEGCDFLITGENLGQVSSQTLFNMTTAQKAVKIPFIRPVLANDKNDTMKIAREIGTYDLSIQPGMCCNLVPKHPCNKCHISFIERDEARFDFVALVDEALKGAEIKALD